MKVLFEKDGYRVEALNGMNHPATIVGFQNRNPLFGMETIPEPVHFLPSYFANWNIKANFVSFIVNRNDWYLTDTARAGAEVIRDHYAGTRIIPYGSSMGGFAAINLSGVLDSACFIALSPISTIFAPFVHEIDDRRYEKDAAASESRFDIIGSGAVLDRKGVIFFDPYHVQDAAHAARLATLTDGALVALAYAGHPCGPMLQQTYSLRRVLAECVAGDLDIPGLRQTLLARTSDLLDLRTTVVADLPDFLDRCEENIRQIRPIDLRIALIESSPPRKRGPDLAPQLRRLAALALHLDMEWGLQSEFRDSTLMRLGIALSNCGEAAFAEASVLPRLSPHRARTFARHLTDRTRRA